MYFRLTHTGELFYGVPETSEQVAAYERIAEKCRDAARLEFGGDAAILARLETELGILKESSNSVTLEIIAEIVEFSEKMGYPVQFDGDIGLLAMYLLGISGIHPSRLGYSSFYTDKFESEAEIYVCMRIAATVASLLETRLSEKFSGVKSDFYNLKRMTIRTNKVLDDVGKMSMMSDISFNEIDFDDQHNKDETASDFAKDKLNWDLHAELGYCAVDPEECLAFESCSTTGAKKTKDLFVRIGKYIFRDEVYDELIKLGIEKENALKMCRLWSRDKERKAEICMLKDLGAPNELIIAFENLYNVWPKDSCITRVKIMKMLNYYKRNNSYIYRKIKGFDL